jgi:hypothetical protein
VRQQRSASPLRENPSRENHAGKSVEAWLRARVAADGQMRAAMRARTGGHEGGVG